MHNNILFQGSPSSCCELEQWWNMISCVYNFLSASTNLASALDANHHIQTAPLSIVEVPLKTAGEEIYLVDYPWFNELIVKGEEVLSNNLNSNKQTCASISNPSVQDPCIALPELIIDTKDMDDSNEVKKTFQSMHSLEQAYIHEFDFLQEEALCSLIENAKESHHHQEVENEAIEEKIEECKEEIIKNRGSDDSCYFQDFTDSEQTITSLALESAYNSLDSVVQRQNFEEDTSANDENTSCKKQEDNLILENIQSQKSMPNANKSSCFYVENNRNFKNKIQSLITKSTKIQTTINKRYDSTIKAQIMKSAELQEPIKVVEKSSNKINNNCKIKMQIINPVEQHESYRDEAQMAKSSQLQQPINVIKESTSTSADQNISNRQIDISTTIKTQNTNSQEPLKLDQSNDINQKENNKPPELQKPIKKAEISTNKSHINKLLKTKEQVKNPKCAVPKNLAELKEQLDCISILNTNSRAAKTNIKPPTESSSCKTSGRNLPKVKDEKKQKSSENRVKVKEAKNTKLPEAQVSPVKPKNPQVKSNLAGKSNLQISKRYSSVESVIKKLILGGNNNEGSAPIPEKCEDKVTLQSKTKTCKSNDGKEFTARKHPEKRQISAKIPEKTTNIPKPIQKPREFLWRKASSIKPFAATSEYAQSLSKMSMVKKDSSPSPSTYDSRPRSQHKVTRNGKPTSEDTRKSRQSLKLKNHKN